MNTQRKSKHLKTNPTIVASSSEEVSSLEWEEIAMAQEEEDLICRMYKLVGERWDLIAGRIPGRTAEEIERFWVMKNHRRSQLR
ncbi:MYB-like transcription factor ETC1 [Arabidopsis thaliana]|uniref:MYB-like transcription factor ETC1 n=4 Tax=Arabidopsis TaxID=3701 RepID=ETC1_ARATH|nr:Homeodomain-like superfamily protein [Arabidopsis thaliana]Q9LNI5.1 RecName: Full=MYB-like transcription factor ETC1; AltName: Full=Protein ENHANCER OF TRY AND CPC 1 [Arabidopsis thaliana]KAG7644682.1 SANT/Myb domain [Arabidopsis thaliana x Arabidopsis arenosa]KAG7652692.1 SANT/Myb domain [Arabidopsis suecica]AAF97342.1 Putative MYB family transcription factor [Arabidopsis thaliana]AAS09988.1 MYB transcription factor [Arabidopsis thaliana]AEE27280.1 Homeodomain-like superfamily protein [Ar|eukprot:NP_171645.1 Homeodomain-like superfamily protein [Arabidopsis thaliana]